MYWIALCPTHEAERTAWGWRALRFTPRVAAAEEALLLEVSTCERLWGGRRQLLRQLLETHEALSPPQWAAGPTSLVALAALRQKVQGVVRPDDVPDGFPLALLTAAQDHVHTLERVGCRTWGQLRALPRGGVSRRFGAALLRALDAAYGQVPESYPWLTLPEVFDVRLELPALATGAPELMWTGQRLLSQLQLWLQGRNLGILGLELEWTLDLRRVDGKELPPHEQLQVRTAEPTQDMAHLRRLVGEHLGRARLAAPANQLRLRSLETTPWGGVTTSLLPEEVRKGEKLHQFIERVSVRLGEGQVLVPRLHEDHRPEGMQRWVPARVAPHPSPLPKGEREKQPGRDKHPLPPGERAGVRGTPATDSLYPAWLLPEPLPLEVHNNVPHYQGRLRRLTRLHRVETAWWEEGGPALRDYFIARSDGAGLVWIYRDRPGRDGRARWYLQGLYA